MTRTPGGLCLALALAFAAPALAKTWQVDAAHSALTFTNTYENVRYSGQFMRYTATIDYDPDDLAHAKFDVTIDIASLDTRNDERDQAALGTDFFDAAKFPQAHFVTTSFRKAADDKVVAEGVLTLRGVSKPVALTVSFKPHGNTATLDVTALVQRLAFGIGSGQWADPAMIGDAVSVRAHLLLRAR